MATVVTAVMVDTVATEDTEVTEDTDLATEVTDGEKCKLELAE